MRAAMMAGRAFRAALLVLPLDARTLADMLAAVDDLLAALEEMRVESNQLAQKTLDAAHPALPSPGPA